MSKSQDVLHVHTGEYTIISGERDSIRDIDILDFINTKIIRDGLVIAWLIHEVKWGYYKNHKFIFSDGSTDIDKRYIQEVRIFNDIEELKITIVNNGLSYRYISDESGKPITYVDSSSRLIGSHKIHTDTVGTGFIRLEDEGRKLVQTIPFETNQEYCYLVTRNYIGYLENHQASYIDYRFLRVTDKGV